MAKEFDATLKDLLEAGPADWLTWLRGTPGKQVRLIDADVSTVTAAADKVLWVEDPEPWIFHPELQGSWEPDPGRRLHLYNTVLGHRHRVPVETVIILLRRQANSPDWTGTWEQHRRDGRRYLEFRYDVVRLWEQPLEPILTGGLSVLPLAPLSDEAASKLPEVLGRLQDRVRDAAHEQAAKLRASTFLLMGLRYEALLTKHLFEGIPGMKESVTYQAILREGEQKGRAEGEKRFLLLVGHDKLGPPSAEEETAIQAIADIDRLERLGKKMLVVSTWQELLATP